MAKLTLSHLLQQPRDMSLWKRGTRWKCQQQEGAGAMGSAHPCFSPSTPLLGVVELILIAPRRSGAETRMPAGRLRRKWICKGVFTSRNLPNLFLQLYDCSPPWGRFPSARLSYFTRTIHSLPATAGGHRPALAPPHPFQYPSPFRGDAARDMRQMSYNQTFLVLVLPSVRC